MAEQDDPHAASPLPRGVAAASLGVEGEIALDHAPAGERSRRGAAAACCGQGARLVLGEVEQRAAQRLRVVRRHEAGGVAPQLDQARHVGRAPARSRRGPPPGRQGRTARSGRVPRRSRPRPSGGAALGGRAARGSAPAPASPPRGGLARQQDRPGQAGRDPRQRRHVLGLVPEPPAARMTSPAPRCRTIGRCRWGSRGRRQAAPSGREVRQEGAAVGATTAAARQAGPHARLVVRPVRPAAPRAGRPATRSARRNARPRPPGPEPGGGLAEAVAVDRSGLERLLQLQQPPLPRVRAGRPGPAIRGRASARAARAPGSRSPRARWAAARLRDHDGQHRPRHRRPRQAAGQLQRVGPDAAHASVVISTRRGGGQRPGSQARPAAAGARPEVAEVGEGAR